MFIHIKNYHIVTKYGSLSFLKVLYNETKYVESVDPSLQRN